jgi:plastocyanin
MRTKAGEVAALLKGRKVYRVIMESPARGALNETTLEDPAGIAVSVEGDTVTFKTNDKTASFVMLENAQIMANGADDAHVITTFAENGGLQIKYRP